MEVPSAKPIPVASGISIGLQSLIVNHSAAPPATWIASSNDNSAMSIIGTSDIPATTNKIKLEKIIDSIIFDLCLT